MGRAPCCDKPNVKKGPWSPEEDAMLKLFITVHGTGGNWITLPGKAGLKRCGKSCRLRWINYLKPDLNHGKFTEEEERIIIREFGQYGSKWSQIAAKLKGRTDNDIKNFWNTRLRKKFAATSGMNSPVSHTQQQQQRGSRSRGSGSPLIYAHGAMSQNAVSPTMGQTQTSIDSKQFAYAPYNFAQGFGQQHQDQMQLFQQGQHLDPGQLSGPWLQSGLQRPLVTVKDELVTDASTAALHSLENHLLGDQLSRGSWDRDSVDPSTGSSCVDHVLQQLSEGSQGGSVSFTSNGSYAGFPVDAYKPWPSSALLPGLEDEYRTVTDPFFPPPPPETNTSSSLHNDDCTSAPTGALGDAYYLPENVHADRLVVKEEIYSELPFCGSGLEPGLDTPCSREVVFTSPSSWSVPLQCGYPYMQQSGCIRRGSW